MCLRSPKEYTIVGRSMGGEELARMQCEQTNSVMSMSAEMKMTLGTCFWGFQVTEKQFTTDICYMCIL